jgi:tetratricopeptide (TPR) repeat protein
LEAWDDGQWDAAQLARHFEYGGNGSKAVHYLRQAGEKAAAAYANLEAIQLFTRALQLTPEADVETYYDLLLARLNIYRRQGDFNALDRDVETLEQLASRLHDKRRSAEAALRRSHYAHVAGKYEDELAAAERALTALAGIEETPLRAEAHVRKGHALFFMGRWDECREEAEKAFMVAQAAESPRWMTQALLILGRYYARFDDVPMARATFEKALRICYDNGEREWTGAFLEGVLNLAQAAGDYSGARRYADEMLQNALAIGDRSSESTARFYLGRIEFDLGNCASAREHLQTALQLDRSTGSKRGQAYVLEDLARLDCEEGMFEQAHAHAAEALQLNHDTGDRQDEPYTWWILGRSLVGLAKPTEAMAALEKALALHEELEHRTNLPRTAVADLAFVALMLRDRDLAQSLVEQAVIALTDEPPQETEPLRPYTVCFQVLEALNDPRANRILDDGYTLLQARAAAITDQEQQRSFLDNVSFNRALLTAWNARHLRKDSDRPRA